MKSMLWHPHPIPSPDWLAQADQKILPERLHQKTNNNKKRRKEETDKRKTIRSYTAEGYKLMHCDIQSMMK